MFTDEQQRELQFSSKLIAFHIITQDWIDGEIKTEKLEKKMKLLGIRLSTDKTSEQKDSVQWHYKKVIEAFGKFKYLEGIIEHEKEPEDELLEERDNKYKEYSFNLVQLDRLLEEIFIKGE